MDNKRRKSRVLHVYSSSSVRNINGRENGQELRTMSCSQQELPLRDDQLNLEVNTIETTQFSLRHEDLDEVDTDDDIDPQTNEANSSGYTSIDPVHEDIQSDLSNSEIYSSIPVNTSEPPPSYEQLIQEDPSTYYSSIASNNRNQENQGLYYVQPFHPYFQYGLLLYAPVQTQPVVAPLNPVSIDIPRQQQTMDEGSQLNNSFSNEHFIYLSISIILMIIFLIFGGPWSLFFTIPGLILVLSSERQVSTKRKQYKVCGYILQLIGGLASCAITLFFIFTVAI